MIDFLKNTWKAHAAAFGTIVLYVFGRLTGFVEAPPVETFGAALNEVVSALVTAGITWFIAYIAPANKPATPPAQ